MNREQAYNLMTEMIKNPNLRKHGVAVEAIMRALCKYLKERVRVHPGGGSKVTAGPHPRGDAKVDEFDEEEWAIVGLLHDADYELIEKDPTRHTLVTEEKLREIGGVSERIINGVKSHHDGIKAGRDNLMESSIYATDELSGLITAAALVRPDKKLSSVTVESVMKRFKEKPFAAGANR